MGDNNDFERQRRELVSRFVESGVIKTESIKKAFLEVPRELFLPEELRYAAYADVALPIGWGATISQPTTIAMMLEALSPETGQKVLEVGSGSGYVLALLSRIVGKKGRVTGMELVPNLVQSSSGLLKRLGCSGNVEVVCGDGSLGWSKGEPYDRILVSAAAPKIPEALKEQLAIGGRLVIPVGALPFFQVVLVLDRLSEEEFSESELGPFAFVPLRGGGDGGLRK